MNFLIAIQKMAEKGGFVKLPGSQYGYTLAVGSTEQIMLAHKRAPFIRSTAPLPQLSALLSDKWVVVQKL